MAGILSNRGIAQLPTEFRRSEPDRYSDPDTAPFDKPLHVEVQDAQGPYKLSAFSIRTKDGWVSAVSRKQLLVEVIGWKY